MTTISMNSFIRTFRFINNHPIAKKNIFAAYWRFLKWQIIFRTNKKRFFVVPFIGGTKVYARKGLTGITGNIYAGLHEFEDMAFVLHFLDESDYFFDIGANVGAYTILASGVKKCKTVSFEPAKSTFDILKKNILLNGLKELVVAENKGVGRSNSFLNFRNNQDTTNHVLNETESLIGSEKIEVVSLNDYCHSIKPALMKIDVEGFETEVLNGASDILKNSTLKAIIIELNGSGGRYGYSDHEIHKKLIEFSFIPFNYDPFKRKLEKQKSYGKHNTIYIRDIEFVQKKIKNSSQFEVFNNKI